MADMIRVHVGGQPVPVCGSDGGQSLMATLLVSMLLNQSGTLRLPDPETGEVVEVPLTEDVLAWAMAEGHVPTLTGLPLALAVQELTEAIDSARVRLPDGSEVSRYHCVQGAATDGAAEDFEALTRTPPEELPAEALDARVREDCRRVVEQCSRALRDAAHLAREHPEWPVPPEVDYFRRTRQQALQVLAQLDARGPSL